MTADSGAGDLFRTGLRVVSWLVLALGLGTVEFFQRSGSSAAPTVLTLALSVFFVLLLVRLVAAYAIQRERRSTLSMLFLAVLLWAVGSALLNGSGQPKLTQFPAPGEWFFLTSYVALAGYLIADAGRRRHGSSATTWLEAAIVCGGTACLAGSVLVRPVAGGVNADGAGLLLTMLYPLIDIVLLLLVIGQVAVQHRPGLRPSAGLLVALTLFTLADLSFIATLHAGTYDYNVLNIAMWGTGFALLVDSGCRASREPPPPRQAPRGMAGLILLGSLAASAVLAFEPAGPVREYLILPALATLAAGGARMVLALRAANRTAEALALSLSDDLTGLPNRRAIIAQLEQRLAGCQPTALMIMDLDGFKEINDTLGHAAGDSVLTHIASRTRAALPSDVMLGRLGGDEFAVMCASDDELSLYEVAQAMLDAVRSPLIVDGIALSADASIGITVRQDADRCGEMMRRADVAMYDAKRSSKKSVLYDPSGDQFSRERLALSEDLRCAIVAGDLELWYQPKFDALTRLVCGVEGLVRWRHPQRGLLNPSEFLSAARRAGLMLSLSELIGKLAVNDMIRWRERGSELPVAINCAPPELMSGVVLPRLAEYVRNAGFAAGAVTVEVTEDSFLVDPDRARTLLLDLFDLGFEISVDDFGTGFSSLSYLRDLPISEVKMDRSFISAMMTDPRSRMIVKSTLQMADALGLRMVAEGVEDEATAVALIEMGVHVLQGYHLSRPMPAHEVPEFLIQTRQLATLPG